ncbi:HEPN domain-containing protein [Pedobacter sp. MC2016-15]|uniref:HEPN domain-containing protein n=1 Tax=Pedobacter sp. MC2016-15 TaxID=2994473 RepID=UPI002248508D|nr:HEPN domain-containing protein [Pedobacter sp. MC2016-15]MCX2480768.1 HEPN domain-containing protein [Pedobacter sp. MC2016-15]
MEMRILTPANDQAYYLKTFIEALVQKFQPLQILCLSQNITSDVSDSCFKIPEFDHTAHYFLLMVTESITRVDHQVQDFSNNYFKKGTVTIITHGKEAIADAIKANSRFFIKAYSSANLLYTSDGYSNCSCQTQYIPGDAAAKASKNYNHRIALAGGFLQGALACINKQQFTVGTFLLHQVVEQCCIALIRVQLGYRSEVHNLYRLLGICRCFSNRPYKLFLTGSKEDQRLFDILVKSYSGARYASDFAVTEAEANQLQDRVRSFVKLTKTMCLNKIECLEAEAKAYREYASDLSLVNTSELYSFNGI